jgi:protein-disulfide isomerase
MAQAGAIDLDRHVYGNLAAAITIVEYGDLECPYCKAAAPVLRKLIDGGTGGIRLIWRHFPLFEVHPFALTAALAAEASGDKFWAMHDVLLANQDRLSDADLARYARQVGVDGEVTGDAAQAYRPAIEADYMAGRDNGVHGTPTLFIDGRIYTGKMEYGALCSALNPD